MQLLRHCTRGGGRSLSRMVVAERHGASWPTTRRLHGTSLHFDTVSQDAALRCTQPFAFVGPLAGVGSVAAFRNGAAGGVRNESLQRRNRRSRVALPRRSDDGDARPRLRARPRLGAQVQQRATPWCSRSVFRPRCGRWAHSLEEPARQPRMPLKEWLPDFREGSERCRHRAVRSWPPPFVGRTTRAAHCDIDRDSRPRKIDSWS